MVAKHAEAVATTPPCAVILVYHSVVAAEVLSQIYNSGKHISVENFATHTQLLAAAFFPISLDECVSALLERQELPPLSVVVTFDDGYRNSDTLARPILERAQIPATVFIVNDFVDRAEPLWTDRLEFTIRTTKPCVVDLAEFGKWGLTSAAGRLAAFTYLRSRLKHTDAARRTLILDRLEVQTRVRLQEVVDREQAYAPLRWEDIARLAGGVFSVGAHTCSHQVLTRCREEEARRQLARSKAAIEERLGVRCDLFAYPNGRPGDFDGKTRRLVAEAGYRAAVTTVDSAVFPSADVLQLPRIAVPGHWTRDDLERRIREAAAARRTGWRRLANAVSHLTTRCW